MNRKYVDEFQTSKNKGYFFVDSSSAYNRIFFKPIQIKQLFPVKKSSQDRQHNQNSSH
jgi:hypothetical protein